MYDITRVLVNYINLTMDDGPVSLGVLALNFIEASEKIDTSHGSIEISSRVPRVVIY